jgi:hypothetical protein
VLQIEPRTPQRNPAAARSPREKKEPTLLPNPLAPWQAWSLAVWMTIVTGAYVISMLL